MRRKWLFMSRRRLFSHFDRDPFQPRRGPIYFAALVMVFGVGAWIVSSGSQKFIHMTSESKGERAAETLHCTAIARETIGASPHLAADRPAPRYAVLPPSSGPHRPGLLRGGQNMLDADPATSLHNLEHGYVTAWLSGPSEQFQSLYDLTSDDKGLLVLSDPQSEASMVIVAWGWRQSCSGALESEAATATIDGFLAEFRHEGSAPEDEF